MARPITPTAPGWYWAVPEHWIQSADNLRVVRVVESGDRLMVREDEGDAPLGAYTFYSAPLPVPEIPPQAGWYKPGDEP